MIQLGSNILDTAQLWTFIALLTRMSAVMFALPGIGTEQVGAQFRLYTAAVIAFALALTGIRAAEPVTGLEIILLLSSEFILGFAMGSIPSYVLGGLAVGGQVIAGAIGLGQANMIDRSLGGNVSVISQVKTMLATVIFLSLDGHHVILRAASGMPGFLGVGLFRPDIDTAAIFTEQLVRSFELAVVISGPVLITTLLTQFVLGLVTKFLPQVNIFIISLPLSLIIGFYLIGHTYPGLARHVVGEFTRLEETVGQVFAPPLGSPN